MKNQPDQNQRSHNCYRVLLYTPKWVPHTQNHLAKQQRQTIIVVQYRESTKCRPISDSQPFNFFKILGFTLLHSRQAVAGSRQQAAKLGGNSIDSGHFSGRFSGHFSGHFSGQFLTMLTKIPSSKTS